METKGPETREQAHARIDEEHDAREARLEEEERREQERKDSEGDAEGDEASTGEA